MMKPILWSLLSISLFGGCAPSLNLCDDVDQSALACDALQSEPQELSATARLTGAPLLDTAATVTLADFEGQRGGFLELGTRDSFGVILLLSDDVAVSLADADGGRTPLAASERSAEDTCSELTLSLEFEADEDVPLWLVIGPTDLPAISLATMFADGAFYSQCE